MSETPAEDCELVRLGIVGLRLDDVDATNVVVFFFNLLACFLFLPSVVLELPGSWELVPLPLSPSSSNSDPAGEACGETNRAVGRGPEAEGPLGFFRMGCKGLVKGVVAPLFGLDADISEVVLTSLYTLESEGLGGEG